MYIYIYIYIYICLHNRVILGISIVCITRYSLRVSRPSSALRTRHARAPPLSLLLLFISNIIILIIIIVIIVIQIIMRVSIIIITRQEPATRRVDALCFQSMLL